MAAHFDAQQAASNAYGELIERDAFLFHWIGEIPGDPVPLSLVPSTWSSLPDLPETEPIRRVFLQSADPESSVCMAASRSAHGCWHVGLGTSRRPKAAVVKATCEWLMSVWAHRNVRGCPPEVVPRLNTGTRSAELWQHHRISRSTAVGALLTQILTPKAAAARIPGAKHLKANTSFARLPARSEAYHVFRASNPLLLSLAFGEEYQRAKAFYAQNPRLMAVSRTRPEFHPVDSLLPHPLN
jgi:hypothetical protein